MKNNYSSCKLLLPMRSTLIAVALWRSVSQTCLASDIKINEAASNLLAMPDFIELKNVGSSACIMPEFSLADDSSVRDVYASGISVLAGGYLLFEVC